jgi:hypothetical protein
MMERGWTRRSALRLLGGVVAASLMGCAPRMRSPAPCNPPLVVMTDWQEAGGSAFTLRLPPRFHADRVQGIDSEVGQWSAEDASIEYDYGWYSDALASAPQGASAVESCEGTVGGRRARVRRYRGPKGEYVVDAHWPASKVAQDDAPRDPPKESSLTLHGVARDPHDAGVLLAIIHSVRFRQ